MNTNEEPCEARADVSRSALIRGVAAARLQAWRRAHRVPMKRLAAELGVSVSTVASGESGQRFPGADNLAALALRTGIPACRFVCDDGTCAQTVAQALAGQTVPGREAEEGTA